MESIPGSVEEKIINAAIECMEKFGVQGTTNRKIAQMAGINSAAINYYFRSKDVLIQRAMEKTLANAFDWRDLEDLPGKTPQQHCTAIFLHLLEGGINYPGIARAHFFDLFSSGDYHSPVVKPLNEFVVHLIKDLQERGLKMDQVRMQEACIQIVTSVFMLILSPRLFETGFNLTMTDPGQREKFVSSLVNHLLQ